MTGAAEAILVALVTTILDLVRRGLLSEECVAGLCAAHPELRGQIDALPAARYRDARAAALRDRSTAAQDADELLRPALVQRLRAAARGPSELHVVDAVLLRAARVG